MLGFDYKNKSQVDQILQLVKIASLSFPAIAFFQYYSKKYAFFQHTILLIAVLLIILCVYVLWGFLQSKIKNKPAIKVWVDPVISLSIAFLSVMLTGSFESSYKFLFIFVIISSSIECSMRASLTISGISAGTVLIIDLLFAPPGTVNPLF